MKSPCGGASIPRHAVVGSAGDLTLQRGSGDGANPVLIVTPAAEYPSREAVRRLEAMNAVADRPRELVIETRREDAEHVRVAVRDVGVGLDAERIHRLFDAFYTTKRDGMGMGLSITCSIIENHGGRLWAVPNEGPGATFRFTV